MKDCVIVYKNGKGIALRATRMTVEDADGMMVTVYDDNGLMAIVPLAEIKTVIFADCGTAEMINSMIEAISK